jgi:hypothetical protein
MRGCSRECCPYSDSDVRIIASHPELSNGNQISKNTRPHLLTQFYPPSHNPPSDQPEGRTGLYYRYCMSSYRPKFICPDANCRRSIKPVYDPDRFEYNISDFQDWSVRPLESHSSGLAVAFRNSRRLQSTSNRKSVELATFKRLKEKFWQNKASLLEDELEFLMARDPSLWWKEFITTRGRSDQGLQHLIRCPSCGKGAVRVGSNFRVPKRKDEKSWKKIERKIEEGEDLLAKFSFCATIGEHEKMVEKALELRCKK